MIIIYASVILFMTRTFYIALFIFGMYRFQGGFAVNGYDY